MTTRKPTDEDIALFRDAVSGTRRLRHDRARTQLPKPPADPVHTRRDRERVLHESLHEGPDLAEVETGEELSFARSGVSRQVLRDLRRGRFSIEAQIDLHGLTVAEARIALAGFLQQSRAAGRRCVRVIHGKGLSSPDRKPILKQKVNGWLQQWNDVLAFCSAPPTDGGTGAAYVLLRR